MSMKNMIGWFFISLPFVGIFTAYAVLESPLFAFIVACGATTLAASVLFGIRLADARQEG